jgi:hypothetical protein
MDSTATTTPTRTVTLIGYGLAPAKPAGELQIGDITVWNYGYKYTVTAIEPKAKTQVIVTLVDVNTGKEWDRVMSRTRLVAIKTTIGAK